jgi:YD repeat-containing protein
MAAWCWASATVFKCSRKRGCCRARLIRNRDLQFHCENVFIKTTTPNRRSPNRIPAGKTLRVPIAHGEGCYYADEETLAKLKAGNQILWQYCDAAGNVTDHGQPKRCVVEYCGHLQ